MQSFPRATNPFPLGTAYEGFTSVPTYNSTHLRTRINPTTISGSTKVIVGFGDSVTANSADTLYTVTQANNLNLNVADGAIYKTGDPVLGASNGIASPFLSCPYAPLGDNLITGSYCANAIVAPNGMGSSKIADWAAGGALNQNITTMAKRLVVLGLSPSAIIWHGGANDAGISQADYAAALASFIATCRASWASTPILIGVCSWNGTAVDTNVQNAQIAAVNHPSGIWAGVNSDAFSTSDDFQSGSPHFNATGRDAWATAAITQLHAAGAI